MEQNKSYVAISALIANSKQQLDDIDAFEDTTEKRRAITERFERSVHALEAEQASVLNQFDELANHHANKLQLQRMKLQKFMQDCNQILLTGLNLYGTNAGVAEHIWQGAHNLEQPPQLHEDGIKMTFEQKNTDQEQQLHQETKMLHSELKASKTYNDFLESELKNTKFKLAALSMQNETLTKQVELQMQKSLYYRSRLQHFEGKYKIPVYTQPYPLKSKGQNSAPQLSFVEEVYAKHIIIGKEKLAVVIYDEDSIDKPTNFHAILQRAYENILVLLIRNPQTNRDQLHNSLLLLKSGVGSVKLTTEVFYADEKLQEMSGTENSNNIRKFMELAVKAFARS